MIKLMRRNHLFIAFLFFVFNTTAQSLTPTVIATAGFGYSSPELQIDMTIGETFITTLQTQDNILTQGFHQPEASTILSVDDKEVASVVSIFPNPATHDVNVTVNGAAPNEVHLFDGTGHIVMSAQRTSSINIQPLAAGMYTLRVLSGSDEYNARVVKE
jgi:hypothetical protein